MKPQVVIFVAPPGAGKGTQADILAKHFSWLHLETSKVIEEKFAKADPNDEEMNKEKNNFLTGELVDPEKVTAWIIEKMGELGEEGKSIIFSGSFRTEYEASQEIPVAEKWYGKENIKLFHIVITKEEAVRRNSNRRICEKNRHPIPSTPEYVNIEACPEDGSKLIKRDLDTPDVIAERFEVYQRRTAPVFKIFADHGYEPIEIDGTQGIEQVSQDILKHFADDDSN